MSRKLLHSHSIADLRRLARRRLPRAVFDYIDGGADDEATLRQNSKRFERYALLPRILRDVSQVDTATTVLGQRIEWPVILAPTALSRICDPAGEAAVARAAAAAGTIYALSSASSLSIEEVGAASEGAKWFQIYVWRDRSLVEEFIERARASGYYALCLTVDVASTGKRERDLRSGFSIPPRPTLRTMFDAARRFRWIWNYLTKPRITLANVVGRAPSGAEDVMTLAEYINSQFAQDVTWDDAAWMIDRWQGPFAIKGILSPEDARQAVEIGADAIVVSNHGGRQLDHSPAPIDVLPEILDATGGRAEVILDGGVRRGTDVLKALALGARACMIGRPYLYGLGAGGEPGVARALKLLRDEVELDLRLLGCPSVSELNAGYVKAL